MTLAGRVSGSVVCDSSALVALLVDSGADGRWVTESVTGTDLAAPALGAFETANILRRHQLTGEIDAGTASQAHRDLLDLAIEWWSYDLLAERSWRLRDNLSIYDASYVALAEALGAPLLTLDRRIAGAPDVSCVVLTP